MSLPLEFHPAFQDDANDAHDWYEQRRSGLGSEFLDEVQQMLGVIGTNPTLYGFVSDDIRGSLLNRFPYAIYYRVLADRIWILAIQHTSRDPSRWQGRS